MISLVQECQLVIVKMLLPKEVKNLYESCEQCKHMIHQLNKYFPFTIESKSEVEKKVINWFQKQKINLIHCAILKNGDQEWYQNGLMHRDNDLPAIVKKNGDKIWYKNGAMHRDNDLPAVIKKNGDKIWYKNGAKNRDNDLPAAILSDGTKFWSQNGQIHRDNGLPAVIFSDGSRMWYQFGEIIKMV